MQTGLYGKPSYIRSKRTKQNKAESFETDNNRYGIYQRINGIETLTASEEISNQRFGDIPPNARENKKSET